MKRAEWKRRARRALAGNYGEMAAAYFLYMLIAGGCMFFPQLLLLRYGLAGGTLPQSYFYHPGRVEMPGMLAGVLAIEAAAYLCMILLAVGMNRMYFEICTQGRTSITRLFWAFVHKPWKYVLFCLLFTGVLALAMVPVIVLSLAAAVSPQNETFAVLFILIYLIGMYAVLVYLSLAWSQFLLVLVEDPQKGLFQALRESRLMMRGNKGRFFVLGLSFMGMLLLAAFSGGIGLFWIVPYMGCTCVMFYLSVRSGGAWAE